jgi:hypothetical protein
MCLDVCDVETPTVRRSRLDCSAGTEDRCGYPVSESAGIEDRCGYPVSESAGTEDRCGYPVSESAGTANESCTDLLSQKAADRKINLSSSGSNTRLCILPLTVFISYAPHNKQ